MTIPAGEFVDYDHPPLSEVVCGIAFASFDTLYAPHVGLLWEKYRSEYPKCREASLLATIIESVDGEAPLASKSIRVEELLSNIPPWPRIWFLDEAENNLIQIQRDRFLHNWKEVKKGDPYPHFQNIFENFISKFSVFKDFLKEENIGELQPIQYELTYVNHIPKGQGWNSYDSLEKVLPDFSRKENQARFLKGVETVNWVTSFLLPNKLGRLHISIKSAVRREDQHPVIILDLTARGIGDKRRSSEMESWFKTAHEWIVRGFSDITGSEVQKDIWRRIK